jgi:protein transport protein SEC20
MERAVERLSELQDRLAYLQDAVGQLKEHITRLANFEFVPGDLDTTASDELSTEIIQLIQEQEEDLDLLQEEVTDIRPSKALKHDKDRLKDGAERLKDELDRYEDTYTTKGWPSN